MGFSVPSCLRLKRWALTPPFHPYPGGGGLFSVALSVNRPRGQVPRVYLRKRSYAASRPTVFGLSSPLINQGSDSPPFQHGDPNTPRGRKQGYRMDPFRTRLTPPLVFAQVPDPPARLRGIFPVGLQPGTKDPDGQKSAHAESRSLSTEPSRFEAPGGAWFASGAGVYPQISQIAADGEEETGWNLRSSADYPSGIGYRRISANGDPFADGFADVQTSPVVCSGGCHDANGAERLGCPSASCGQGRGSAGRTKSAEQ